MTTFTGWLAPRSLSHSIFSWEETSPPGGEPDSGSEENAEGSAETRVGVKQAEQK